MSNSTIGPEVGTGPVPMRSAYIPRAIDNTALDAYMMCPAKYDMAMRQNRRHGGAPPPPLAYGTLWHAILAAHYRTGGDRAAVLRASVMEWEPHDRPDDHRTRERALLAYEEYLKRWGSHDQDCSRYGKTVGYVPGDTSQALVEISTELGWNAHEGVEASLHPYAGKIDRIVDIDGLFYVEDHKTTSLCHVDGPASGNFFKQFDPNNQMMGYTWLARLLTGLPIAGVRVNAHGVLKTKDSFQRQIFSFSPERLAEWVKNLNRWTRRIEDSYRLNDFPHQFNACPTKYGMCTYHEICSLPERLQQRALEADFEVHEWNPLEDEDI